MDQDNPTIVDDIKLNKPFLKDETTGIIYIKTYEKSTDFFSVSITNADNWLNLPNKVFVGLKKPNYMYFLNCPSHQTNMIRIYQDSDQDQLTPVNFGPREGFLLKSKIGNKTNLQIYFLCGSNCFKASDRDFFLSIESIYQTEVCEVSEYACYVSTKPNRSLANAQKVQSKKKTTKPNKSDIQPPTNMMIAKQLDSMCKSIEAITLRINRMEERIDAIDLEQRLNTE